MASMPRAKPDGSGFSARMRNLDFLFLRRGKSEGFGQCPSVGLTGPERGGVREGGRAAELGRGYRVSFLGAPLDID